MCVCVPAFFMALLVCGTPGVGKTTFCEELARRTEFKHVEVARLIEEKKLYSEWDDENNCSIFDEDLVADEIEAQCSKPGVIIDFHSVDFIPPRLFQLIVVLRCETDVLYRRLEERHYSEKKIRGNIECEIFQVVLDEVKEAFEEVPLIELRADTIEDIDKNVQTVISAL